MAKILSSPKKIMEINGVPVILTYKTVKRINIRIGTDEIKVSAPSSVTEDEVVKVIENMRDGIESDLKEIRKSRGYKSSAKANGAGHIDYDFEPIDGYPVIVTPKKNAKRLIAKVKPGQVTITVPYGTEKEQVQEFMDHCMDWIKEHIQKNKEAYTDVGSLKEINAILLFGKKIPIVYVETTEMPYLHKSKLYLDAPLKDDRDKAIAYIDWFIEKELRAFIQKRILFWEEKTGLKVKKFVIKKMTSRWGSCSTKSKILHFNFYLAMLPTQAIDSVVIHEIAHIQEANHQSGFYDLIHKFFPTYDKQNELIKQYRLPLQYCFE